MKRLIVPIAFCLCWLMVSCSSAPSAEDQAVPEYVPSEQAAQEQVAQEQDEDRPDGPSVASDDSGQAAALDNSFPVDDFLPPVEEGLPVSPQEDSQDYLQEIEIIDLVQDEPSSDFDQEGMAVVVEPEVALVVETPASAGELPPDLPPADGQEMALIVENPSEPADDAAGLEPEPEGESLSESAGTEGEPQAEDMAVSDPGPPEDDPVALEENAGSVDMDEAQGVPEDVVVPSRSVVMDNHQYLDIRYPGAGWVYLGEVAEDGTSIGTPSLTYFGRRRTSEDTSFTLRSSSPGTTILHFYKQDVLSATFIDDFLEVTITDQVAKNGFRVVAPSYEALVPGYQDAIPRPKDYAQAEMPLSDTVSEAQGVNSQDQAAESGPAVAGDGMTGTGAEPDVAGDGMTSAGAGSAEAGAGMTGAGAVSAVAERPPTATASEPQPVTPTVPAEAGDGATGAGAGSAEVEDGVTGAGAGPAVAERPPTATASEPQPVAPTVPAEAGGGATGAGAGSAVDANAAVAAPPRSETEGQNAVPGVPPSDSIVQQELPEEFGSAQDYGPQTGVSMEEQVAQEPDRQQGAGVQAPSEGQYSEQDELLAQAQEYFYAEEYPASLDTLNKFFDVAVRDFDAAYYLKGQVLESQSPVKNIKEAQKAYKHVMDSYPQSPFWERSKNRYTYLSRLYFDIR